MTDDLSSRLRELLASVGTLPLDENWMYSSIRHCERNMDFEEHCPKIEAGETHTPDRQCGGEIAKAVNALPTLLDRIDALQAENERLRGQGECICAKCGLRHGSPSVTEGW